MNAVPTTHQDTITNGGVTLRALRRYPDRIALIDGARELSYAGAAALVGRYQAVLHGAGARPGMAFALLTANRYEGYLVQVAGALTGLRYTPLHPMGGIDDHLAILSDAEIDLLVVDVPTHAERARELAAKADRPPILLTLGPADVGGDLIAAAEAVGEVEPRNLATADLNAALYYTGGTTGRPKGALRRHPSMVASIEAILADFDLPDPLRFLAISPISHVGGSKIGPTLVRGGTVAMQAGFDPEALLHQVERHRLTATLLVPTMIYALLDTPALAKADLSSLAMIMYGASPMSPSRLAEGIERLGPVFSQLYGQTECYPLCVLPRADHDLGRPDRLVSCGHPVANADVKLFDEAMNEVGVGEPGEICARAPQAMDRYWKRPRETAEALAGGWLHTGDIATRDDEGYLTIVDRKKDMIVSGGFNVYPREVEDVLSRNSAVAMAAVIGVPDEKWGEAVTAFVVPRPGMTVDPGSLKAAVRDAKGPVYQPKRIEIVDAIPLTPIGKPDKKRLRDTFWHDQDRKVG